MIDVNENLADEIGRLSLDRMEARRCLAISEAEKAYSLFMDAILPGWMDDPNCIDTPKRVARMYVNELLSGIYFPKPKITSFDNVHGYDGLVFSGGVTVKSMCSHHHAFFVGKAYIAYIPSSGGKIIGLSKLNRLVNYYSRRAQIQESLTANIHKAISDLTEENRGVAVIIHASHSCVSHRGAGDNSVMKTAKLSGLFFDDVKAREEYYHMISSLKH
jgi:GTP cyclohydrolase I